MIDRTVLDIALAHAAARCEEHEGISDKLAAVGIDAEGLESVIRDRIVVHKLDRERAIAFVQGYIEGIITGLQVRK